MAVIAALSGNVTLTDNVSGTTPLSKVLQSLSTTGTNSDFAQGLALTAGVNAVQLPISPTQFLYVKNVSPATGTATAAIAWVPTGLTATATVATLEPGGWLAYGNVTAGAGITVLNVSCNVACAVEAILLG